jgi:AbrB family looped-hinge helix DNA binding protein
MSTATLTSKGQITIPVEVRNDLKVDAGDRVEFVLIAPGRYEFVAATSDVTALKGMFGQAKNRVSIESMNAAIAKRGAGARC